MITMDEQHETEVLEEFDEDRRRPADKVVNEDLTALTEIGTVKHTERFVFGWARHTHDSTRA